MREFGNRSVDWDGFGEELGVKNNESQDTIPRHARETKEGIRFTVYLIHLTWQRLHAFASLCSDDDRRILSFSIILWIASV